MSGNIFSFHGCDHKAGVTMVSQSAAQRICEKYTDKSVLLLAMNPKMSCDFVREDAYSIDDIRLHVENRTLSPSEIKMMCHRSDNFYMLGGIRNIVDERNYFPETAVYLLDIIKDTFDIIICDTGSSLDNGLAFGALEGSGHRICIIPQCESGMREYENRQWLYQKFEISFEKIVINKYFPKDPYDADYICDRLGLIRNDVMTVRMAGYARQAEKKRKTLLSFNNDIYGKDIDIIADYIAGEAGFAPAAERRRRLWRTGSL